MTKTQIVTYSINTHDTIVSEVFKFLKSTTWQEAKILHICIANRYMHLYTVSVKNDSLLYIDARTYNGLAFKQHTITLKMAI